MISNIAQEQIYENRNLKLFTSINKQALQFKVSFKQPNGKQKQLHAKLQSQKQLQQKYMELQTYEELKKFIKQNSVVQVDLQQNILIIKDKDQNNLLNKIQIQLDGKKQYVSTACMELILQKCGKKQNIQSDDIKQIFQSIAQTLQILQTNNSNYQKVFIRQQIKIRDNTKYLHRNSTNKLNPESWVSQNSLKIVQDRLQKEIKQNNDKYIKLQKQIKQNNDKYIKKLADNQLKLDVKLAQYQQELSDIKTKITNLENSEMMRQDQQVIFQNKILNDYVTVKNYQLDFTNFSDRIKCIQAHLQAKLKKYAPVNLKQWIDQPNMDEVSLQDNRIISKKECQIYSKRIIKNEYRYSVNVIKKEYFISLGIIDKKQKNNQTPNGSLCNEIIFNNYGECFLFGQTHNKKQLQIIKDGDQVTVYINRVFGFIQWSINGSIIYTIKHQIILDTTNIDWVACITLDSKNDTIEISQIV